MAYHVEVSARAKRDLSRLLDWLQDEGAGGTGLQWWLALQRAIASLESSPRRCALAPENQFARQEVRHLLHGRKPHEYRIVFTVEDDLVTVLHIRHGRRLPFPPQ